MPLKRTFSLEHSKTSFFPLSLNSFILERTSSTAREFASKYPDRILILRYEEMLIRYAPPLSPAYPRLGLACDSRVITEAARKSSFEHLQKVEQESGGETLAKGLPSFEPAQAVSGEITSVRNCPTVFTAKPANVAEFGLSDLVRTLHVR